MAPSKEGEDGAHLPFQLGPLPIWMWRAIRWRAARIGRLVLRAASADPDAEMKAVNDPFMDLDYLL